MKAREFLFKPIFPAVKPPEQLEKGAQGPELHPSSTTSGKYPNYFQRRRGFFVAAAGLAVFFGLPLYRLARFAAGSDLHSYILLMPFVSLYLIWLKKDSLLVESEPARQTGVLFLTGGLALLATYWLIDRQGLKLTAEDRLAFTTLSFLLMIAGIGCLFLDGKTASSLAFPMGMLVFMVPFPTWITNHIEAFLQQGSAICAEGLFSLSGTTFSRDGMLFLLPGIRIQVAPECSGIHSSIVLFIVSLLAGYLFLRSPGKRAVLTLAMIPLALLRNGFRIFTIGQLCIHIGPQMIDSPIHRRGGPLFFIASLVPFLALLLLLQRAERKKNRRGPEPVMEYHV